MSPGSSRRLVIATILIAGLMLSCTTPAPTPASKEGPATKPAAVSPSPVAQASPTALAPRPVVGGGAAQPRAAATQQSIGGSAIIIVPTPNLAANPTVAPAALAPGVSLTTPQAANIPQVTGTLSRIPTAIPGGGGGGTGGGGSGSGSTGTGSTGSGTTSSGTGAAAAAGGTTAGGGGGGAGAQTIPAVLTATPPVRINPQPQPQPAIVFPGGSTQNR